jgi:sulfatase modifying factor 1
MDKVLEAIFELVPFASLFESWGFSKEKSAGLAVVVIALLVWGIVYVGKYLINHYKNSKAANDLAPWLNYGQVKEYRRNFISSKFQNQSPTKEDEPSFSTKFVSKSPLIPFFIKTGFNEKNESDKFYLVLADSGMGKTTFMVNLFVEYHSFFHFRRKYKMCFFPFRDDSILDKIKEMKPAEVKNTILLLDAFDEDKKLLELDENKGLTDEQRFRKRMDEIVDTVRDFREVIITSRTQYFPGQENKDYELKIPRFDGKGFHKLAKMYLSPFDKTEIKQYLNKKYGRLPFINRKKKRIAATIVQNSPKLMVRPMLLSYIDYLVDGKREFKNTYDIYETLIEKWIEREADKRKHRAEDREFFKQNLNDYSQLVALKIYEERKTSTSNMLWLKKETAVEVARTHQIDLKNYEITGQSLLTRDAEGNWKFAHKSILEYFLAKEAIENPSFALEIDFTGMDMAEEFYKESFPVDLKDFAMVREGVFQMGSGEKGDHEVTLSDYFIGRNAVTQKEWKEIMGSNPSNFKGENLPVEKVSWNDVQMYIQKLNKKTGKSYRLPTEAEWEFAARGGNESKGYIYSGSNKLEEVGWYNENSKQKTHPVGELQFNELGIFDMSGNVWEWCEDYYGDYKNESQTDPQGAKTDSNRVLRGGSWGNYARNCRVSIRINSSPDISNISVGFRLAHSSSGASSQS